MHLRLQIYKRIRKLFWSLMQINLPAIIQEANYKQPVLLSKLRGRLLNLKKELCKILPARKLRRVQTVFPLRVDRETRSGDEIIPSSSREGGTSHE